MLFLKQSTAFTETFGPILDSTGAEYTSAVIGDLSISKNGTEAAMAAAATLTHTSNGHYALVGTTGNSDTLGRTTIRVNKAGYQSPVKEYMVMPATVFDALITNATTAAGGLGDIQRMAGTALTGRDIGASVLLSSGTGTGQLSITSGIAKVDVDTIKTNPVVNAGTVTFPTTATLASTTNITAGTVTTATNVTTVNGLAANVITATSINADAITAAKIADGAIDAATFAASAITATVLAADCITAAKVADGTIDAATFAAGAINAAAIAADAITDAKVASDVTIASVTGAVGSVTGAVGSVTGAVGSVTGSVGSIATGGIAAASFAAGAIDAAAIATDAIGSAELAASAVTEIQSGLATSSALTTAQADLDDIQTRIPAALTANGNMKSSLVEILTTALTETAGLLAGGFKKFFNIATPAATMDHGILVDTVTTTTTATTATNLTNAPTAGDFTATMKTSIGTAVAASAVASVTGNVGGNVTGSVGSVAAGGITASSIAADAIGASELAADAVTEIAGAVWDVTLASHLTAGTTGNALNAAGSAGDPWSTSLPGAYGAGSAGKIIGDNVNATISSRASQTSVDDIPTNAELATALAAADDAVLAAIAALNNLSQANIRTAVGLATANLDTQLDALPTNAELATALAAADDATLAAIAALNNLSQANVRTAVGLASANLDTQLSTIDDFLDTEVAAIKAKTDNLPASPAATGDIPTSDITAIKTRVELALPNAAPNVVNGLPILVTGPAGETPRVSGYARVGATTLDSIAQAVRDVNNQTPLTNSLGEAVNNAGGGGSAPTVGQIADAVWDEAIAGHLTSGTTGAKLNAASAAGDPWSTALPGSYASGEAGEILGNLESAFSGSSITPNTSFDDESEELNVKRVDDYTSNTDQEITFNAIGYPVFPANSVYFRASRDGSLIFAAVLCTTAVIDSNTQSVTLSLTRDQVVLLNYGAVDDYRFRCTYVADSNPDPDIDNGEYRTIRWGKINVERVGA